MAPQVTSHQLNRLACLYIRQSTLQQVFEHRESTARQYHLRERALALGWKEERILLECLLREYTDTQTAEQLNMLGYRTFEGSLFQSTHVSQLRRHQGIKDLFTHLREQGMMTATEIAHICDISLQSVWRRYHQGRIVGIRYNDRGTCLFAFPPSVERIEQSLSE